MDVLVQVAQLMLSLSILVVLHELGHFLPAKFFKTKVEKFYLFFNPWFSVFKKKIGETEYGLGWLPLGGYVKIAGMVDESMDTEQLNKDPEPWEFRSKPAWQRLIIMLGGVTVNIILAIAIYSMLLFVNGEKYLPVSNVTYGFMADSLALSVGFQHGDKIIGYDNGKTFESINTIVPTILLENALSIQVDRNGEKTDVKLPQSLYKAILDKKGAPFLTPAFPAEIGDMQKGSPIEKAGGQTGDMIIGLNEAPVRFFDELRMMLQSYKGQEVELSVLRNGDTIALRPVVSDAGLIGFSAPPLDKYFTLVTKEYGFFASFPAGVKKTGSVLSGYIKQFKILFNPEMEGHKHIGSFITITKLFPKLWDWNAFWNLTAFLSIMLAFLNVLPIPALDGGHALFTIWEMITGKKPSDKFLERAQLAGMIVLLTLMVYAFGNDIFRNVLN